MMDSCIFKFWNVKNRDVSTKYSRMENSVDRDETACYNLKQKKKIYIYNTLLY